MQYSTLIRKKDKGYQYIITYKENDCDIKWKTKSKQGYALNKGGKELARIEMDLTISLLKKEVENQIDTSLRNITFKKFSDMYIAHITLYREMNTVLAFKTTQKHFKNLNDIEMTKITTMDIQPIVDDLTKSGIKSNTIKLYIIQLNTIFNSAINDYNILYKTPIKNLKYNKCKEEINKRALNEVECEKILEDFKETRYYLLILIALKCGLRLGEILGLNWEDVDEINNVIKVTKQWKQLKDGSYGFGTLKSKNSYREVPISPKTLALLNNAKVRTISGRILNFKNTDSISICLNRLFRLGGYKITIHELRHTYATTLISNGAPYKVAAQFLGHTEQQTMKSYSHINDDMIKKATSIINNIL